MTFAQRRNRLTTHFSESISVVKRRISVFASGLPTRVASDRRVVGCSPKFYKLSESMGSD